MPATGCTASPTDVTVAARGRGGENAVRVLVAAVFVVPAALLALADPPARFGFQMYSGYGTLTTSWTDGDGEQHPVTIADHLASPRREVDWTTTLPSRLCPRLPGAVAVEVRQTARGGDRVGRATC